MVFGTIPAPVAASVPSSSGSRGITRRSAVVFGGAVLAVVGVRRYRCASCGLWTKARGLLVAACAGLGAPALSEEPAARSKRAASGSHAESLGSSFTVVASILLWAPQDRTGLIIHPWERWERWERWSLDSPGQGSFEIIPLNRNKRERRLTTPASKDRFTGQLHVKQAFFRAFFSV